MVAASNEQGELPMSDLVSYRMFIDGLRLSLSRAIREGDFVFLTGQIPL